MTRKDFELLAGALRTARKGAEHISGVDIAIQNIAWSLSAEHPRFNQERFLIAAGHMAEAREAHRVKMLKQLNIN